MRLPSPKPPRPLVAKVGGSLAGSPELTAWLAALDRYQGPLVLVPGGGAFADTVRSMQTKMRFGDAAAHDMALLAMRQYALALAALWPRLSCVGSLAAVRRALRTNKIACWAPDPETLDAALPRSWNVTSDTLSAWLAGELRIKKLLLIKSADVGSKLHIGLGELKRAKMLDAAFAQFGAASGAEIFVAGPGWLNSAATLLAQGQVPGARLRLP